MKIVCFGYRRWAINIYNNIKLHTDNEIFIYKNKKDLTHKVVKKKKPELILFYGWSWIIPKKIYQNYKCLMLHPSDLPKFRGGSPIQNQIIRGLEETKVTIFRINEIIDGGNILYKKKLSLKGEISDIFKRIEIIGLQLTLKILKNKYKEKPQDHSNASYFKRLTGNSELTLDEIKNKNSTYIYNKIRMLTDPYPNSYIKTKDNKKILIKSVKLEKK